MRITLTVVSGPHKGQRFSFAQHDTFLVGRSKHAHFQLRKQDKFVSRLHFLMELNPPYCRIVDLGSHNGTFVNDERVLTADVKDGDKIRAGHSTFRLKVAGGKEPGSKSGSRSGSHAGNGQGASKLELDAANQAASSQSASSKGASLPGEIGGFHIVGEIGRGDMGVTCLAGHSKHSQPFALKLVQIQNKTSISSSSQAAEIRRFLNDARQLKELDHPRIARLRHMGKAKESLYFAYDYIKGTDVGAVVENNGPMELAPVLLWTNQLLHAIEYAHGKGVLHLALKPTNLVLANRGKEAWITDFGLGRLFQMSKLSGLSMLQAGGAAFLPPELIFRYDSPSPASDQYGLAACLYYLLTGSTVYDFPDEVNGQFSTLLVQKPVSTQSRRPDLPSNLAAALDRALSRSPKQRFPSLAAFRRAFLGKTSP